jgi:hypothetical protein
LAPLPGGISRFQMLLCPANSNKIKRAVLNSQPFDLKSEI